jgi:type IV pilus biogenesis protein PilP
MFNLKYVFAACALVAVLYGSNYVLAQPQPIVSASPTVPAAPSPNTLTPATTPVASSGISPAAPVNASAMPATNLAPSNVAPSNVQIVPVVNPVVNNVSKPVEPPKPQVMTKEQQESLLVAREIADINQRIALLSAQLAELDLQAQIAIKQAELKKSTSGSSLDKELGGDISMGSIINAVQQQMPPLPISAEIGGGVASSLDEPSLLSIGGIDGELRAVISVDGGRGVTVRENEDIGGWNVASIQKDRVVIQQGGISKSIFLSKNSERNNSSANSANRPSVIPNTRVTQPTR